MPVAENVQLKAEVSETAAARPKPFVQSIPYSQQEILKKEAKALEKQEPSEAQVSPQANTQTTTDVEKSDIAAELVSWQTNVNNGPFPYSLPRSTK